MTANEERKNQNQKLKELLRWRAPARPFKKRDREYYTTIGAIVFLLAVILLFMKEWMLIAVIVALAFVSYVIAAVEPDEVEHVISNKGVMTGGKFYPWEELSRFWFEEKWRQKLLVLEVKKGFPGRLMLLLNKADNKGLKGIVSEYLEQNQPEPGLADRAARWLSEKVPLEYS